jgi:hypothetical protein
MRFALPKIRAIVSDCGTSLQRARPCRNAQALPHARPCLRGASVQLRTAGVSAAGDRGRACVRAWACERRCAPVRCRLVAIVGVRACVHGRSESMRARALALAIRIPGCASAHNQPGGARDPPPSRSPADSLLAASHGPAWGLPFSNRSRVGVGPARFDR